MFSLTNQNFEITQPLFFLLNFKFHITQSKATTSYSLSFYACLATYKPTARIEGRKKPTKPPSFGTQTALIFSSAFSDFLDHFPPMSAHC